MKIAISTIFALLSAMPLITAQELKQDLTLSFISRWTDAEYHWSTSAPLSYDKDKVGENRSVDGEDWPYLGDWMKYSETDNGGKRFGVQRGDWGQICNVTVDKDPGIDQAYIKMFGEGDKKKIISDHEEQGVHIKCEDGDVSKLDKGDGVEENEGGDGKEKDDKDDSKGEGNETNAVTADAETSPNAGSPGTEMIPTAAGSDDGLAALFAAVAPAFTGSGQTPPWEVSTAGPESTASTSAPTSAPSTVPSSVDTTTTSITTAMRRRGVRGFRG